NTLDEAYAVQDALIELIDEEVVGWKIGCTSQTAQMRVGASEPFAGRILKGQVRSSHTTVERGESFLCGVQVEFAFRLSRDLDPEHSFKNREDISSSI